MDTPPWLKQSTAQSWLELSGRRLRPNTRLLILQATPYCNIDCSYCYLPNRNARGKMSMDTVRAAISAVQADGLNNGGLTVGWNAGETLVLPASYYRSAFEVIREEELSTAPVALGFQTNATLATEEHCELFLEYGVSVGVSLDGPAFLHDAHRRTRSDRGTHARTLRGLKLLQSHEIDPSVICVVTKRTLEHGQELVEFFRSLGVTRLSLNFEEIDGINTSSSLQDDDLGALETFLREVYWASQETGVRVREFHEMGILTSQGFVPDQLVTAFSTLTVDWQGNFSTFSPELAYAKSGQFCFGNVHTDSILSALENPQFEAAYTEIRAGVSRCQAECSLFDLCGGGAPTNKLAELGTFAGTETRNCRIRVKTVAKVYRELSEAAHAPV